MKGEAREAKKNPVSEFYRILVEKILSSQQSVWKVLKVKNNLPGSKPSPDDIETTVTIM